MTYKNPKRGTRLEKQLERDSKAAKRVVKITRLERVRQALLKINEQLDIVEENDPYGDIIENFQDGGKGERATDRIVTMINEDLKKLGL